MSQAPPQDKAVPPSLLASSVGRLRMIGLIEGTSFLALLFVAMPLKYMMEQPAGVYWLGRAHGGLWILYLMALVDAWLDRGWSLPKVFALFIASVLPFGPFVAERQLKSET